MKNIPLTSRCILLVSLMLITLLSCKKQEPQIYLGKIKSTDSELKSWLDYRSMQLRKSNRLSTAGDSRGLSGAGINSTSSCSGYSTIEFTYNYYGHPDSEYMINAAFWSAVQDWFSSSRPDLDVTLDASNGKIYYNGPGLLTDSELSMVFGAGYAGMLSVFGNLSISPASTPILLTYGSCEGDPVINPPYPGLAPWDNVVLPNTRSCVDSIVKDVAHNAAVRLYVYNQLAVAIGNQNSIGLSVEGMLTRIASDTAFKVEIDEAILPVEVNPYTNDTTKTNGRTIAVPGKVRISLNSNYLNQATDLAVARTFIHESIHAYFIYGMGLPGDPGYSDFVATHDLLYKKNGDPVNDQNNAHHQQIAVSYVDGIAEMLQGYAIDNGISAPPSSGLTLEEYCKDLAWAGLEGTRAYRKYAPNKSRIQQNIINEQTASANSTTKKGC